MLEEGKVPKEIVGLLKKPLIKYFYNSVDCEFFRKELKLDLGFNLLLSSRKGLAIADKTLKKATLRKKATSKKLKASASDENSDMSDEGKKKKKKKGKKPVKLKADRKRKKAEQRSDSDKEDEPAKKKKKK